MNRYLIRSERTWLAETILVEEIEGPRRYRLTAPTDALRGSLVTAVVGVVSFAVFWSPVVPGDLSARAWIAGLVVFLVGGWVLDRTVLSRHALRNESGETIVVACARFATFGRRMHLRGPGGTDASLRVGPRTAAIEVAGHPEIEIRGSALEGRYDLVQSGRVIGRVSTFSADAEGSVTLDVEPGPYETLLIAAAAVLDRTTRKTRGFEAPPG